MYDNLISRDDLRENADVRCKIRDEFSDSKITKGDQHELFQGI